jgi:hypothetical protein
MRSNVELLLDIYTYINIDPNVSWRLVWCLMSVLLHACMNGHVSLVMRKLLARDDVDINISGSIKERDAYGHYDRY